MANQDIPLFAKIYEFEQKLYQLNKKLPKRDRYVLGAKMENCSLDLLEQIIRATDARQQDKLKHLNEANAKLEIIKVLLRLANDNDLLSPKQYLMMQEILQEAGRMLGGWIRYQRKL